jgi:hypothetical protein
MPNSNQSEQQQSSERAVDSEVGYKKPPKHTQFAKGQSGNPNGRPKQPDGISIRELLNSEQHGKNGATISKREALVVRLMNDAMTGNQKAFGRFLNLLTAAGLLRSETPPRQHIIYLPEQPSPSPATYEAWKRKNGVAQSNDRGRG